MSSNVDLVRRSYALASQGAPNLSDDEVAALFTPDVRLDMTVRVFNPKVYEGYEGLREFREDRDEIWATMHFEPEEVIEEGDRVLVFNRLEGVGRGSGMAIGSRSATLWTIRDGRIAEFRLLGGVERGEALAALRGERR